MINYDLTDVKEGEYVVAMHPCTMNYNKEDALIVGKKYKVLVNAGESIYIDSEEGLGHEFYYNTWDADNKFLKPCVPKPKYFNE